jgi:hypothetical protein
VLLPIIGAAGGAWAIAVASEQPGADRLQVALTGAGIGVMVAGASTGWVRQLAGGAAAAGAAIALIEYLRERDAAKRTATKSEAAPPAAANVEAAQAAAAPPGPVETATNESSSAADALTAEEWARLQTIAARLDPEEHKQLDELEQREPALMLKVKKALVSMSVDDAVAFLRQKLFAKPHGRARNGTHASAVGS